jgi:3-methyladenine DNA glycosylase AlkD
MSEASAKAGAFVSDHLEQATAVGHRMADLTEDSDAFVLALRDGLSGLVDPTYTDMAERVSPGTSAPYAVRKPLVEAVQRPLKGALLEGSSISALRLAQRLIEAEDRDLRLFALPCLRRALHEDPEQTWQAMRQMGRGAADWIEVDSLADVWARGVLAEHFRWAELEQLAYSQRTFERRLVGATLATIPHRGPRAQSDELLGAPVQQASAIIGLLMGDAEVMVQKALSWAIREWTRVDADAAAELLRAQTDIAVRSDDGARAWVVRDALSSQPPELSTALRDRLAGIRRHPGAPSTSIAAGQAALFATALSATNDVVAAQGDRYTRSRT